MNQLVQVIYTVFLLIKKYIHMVKKQKTYILKGLIMETKWTLPYLSILILTSQEHSTSTLSFVIYLSIIEQYT